MLSDSASALFASCIHRREAALSTTGGAKNGSPFVGAGFRRQSGVEAELRATVARLTLALTLAGEGVS